MEQLTEPAIAPPSLILLIGPPGAGKSTFARKFMEQHSFDRGAYISNDLIAKDLFGVTLDRGDKDGAIFAEQDRRVAERLKNGQTAIVDATNVKSAARERLIAIAKKFNQPVIACCFRRDIATLLKQNKMREVAVPEEMVREYAVLMRDVNRERLEGEGITTIFEV